MYIYIYIHVRIHTYIYRMCVIWQVVWLEQRYHCGHRLDFFHYQFPIGFGFYIITKYYQNGFGSYTSRSHVGLGAIRSKSQLGSVKYSLSIPNLICIWLAYMSRVGFGNWCDESSDTIVTIWGWFWAWLPSPPSPKLFWVAYIPTKSQSGLRVRNYYISPSVCELDAFYVFVVLQEAWAQ